MMKKLLLTMGLAAISAIGFGQIDTLYSTTYFPVSVWDTPSIVNRNKVSTIPVGNPVTVFNSTYGNSMQFYLLADSSGYVVANLFQSTPVNRTQQSSTKPTSTYVDPCKKAEYYRQRFINTSSMIDWDNFSKWTAKCMDKQY